MPSLTPPIESCGTIGEPAGTASASATITAPIRGNPRTVRLSHNSSKLCACLSIRVTMRLATPHTLAFGLFAPTPLGLGRLAMVAALVAATILLVGSTDLIQV